MDNVDVNKINGKLVHKMKCGGIKAKLFSFLTAALDGAEWLFYATAALPRRRKSPACLLI
jgi:hypothetical protein